VFVSDPIGDGLIASLSRPGGHTTGFIPWEPTMAGKWVELLTTIAPGVNRIATLFNPDTAPHVTRDYVPSFESATRSLGAEPIVAAVHNDAEIEGLITSLGSDPKSGLV